MPILALLPISGVSKNLYWRNKRCFADHNVMSSYQYFHGGSNKSFVSNKIIYTSSLLLVLVFPLSHRHFLVGSSSSELSGVVGVRARRCPMGEPNGLLGGVGVISISNSSLCNHRCWVHSLAVILSLKGIKTRLFAIQENVSFFFYLFLSLPSANEVAER